MPEFLLPALDKAAAFAGLDPSDLQHALITEYGPGAAIGWHKDKAVFAEVVGISLLSPCTFRFRQGGLSLGARVLYRRAVLGLPPERTIADGMGAQHSRRR